MIKHFPMTSLVAAYDARIAALELRDDPAQRAVLEPLAALAAKLANGSRPLRFFNRRNEPAGGVYLWGSVGRGKSMLMDMFVTDAGVEKIRRVHFHEFMQSVHAGMNAARAAGKADALAPVADEIVANVRLLALDEMQISDIADAMIVGRLFQRLLDGGVSVLTTSNRPPWDLYKDGLNRKLFEPFIQLIEDRLEVIELSAEQDYRRARIAGDAVYFTPNDDDARSAMDRLWTTLTRNRATTLDLTIKGRVLHLPQYRNGAGRISFAELCERPLGAADYLALADTLRVLFLDDIPRLNSENFDAAKRFVILIDTLYEAKVRLIATAAAQPEELYTDGTGSLEFERTASRLIEMQGADWGQG